MSDNKVDEFQDILDTYFEEYTAFALTGENQPDFSAFTKELDDLGADARDAYIKENKTPHILNMFTPTQNLLRAEERCANEQAAFFKPLYDTMMEHGEAHESVAAEKRVCLDRMKDMGASSEDAATAIAQVERAVQDQVARQSLDQKQSLDM